MSRTVIDIDDEMLARAQRALRTSTKRDTVNAALQLAAAVDADRRGQVLDSFQTLLGRLDLDLIEQDEKNDHLERPRDLSRRHVDDRPAAPESRCPPALARYRPRRPGRRLPSRRGGVDASCRQQGRPRSAPPAAPCALRLAPDARQCLELPGASPGSAVDAGQQKGPSVVDLLVAATAEAWDLTVLHVDADFETIARVAPIRTQRADAPPRAYQP